MPAEEDRSTAGAPRRGRTSATRADVAKMAGTSEAVVSYVVNNGPRSVAPHTRDRVLKAIESTGYRPNHVAKSLASGTTGIYGLILPDIANPFFASFAYALEQAARTVGKHLLLNGSNDDPKIEAEILKDLSRLRVDGLLVIGHRGVGQMVGQLPEDIPVVILDRVGPEVGKASVSIDNIKGAFDATSHLLSHGYKDIGIIEGPTTVPTARDRAAGWEQALAAANGAVRPHWRRSEPFTKSGGLHGGRRILDQQDRPRAIFASNEQQAIGLLRAAAELGIRVPEQLAIFSFDGTVDSAYTAPPLSTVVQPIREIAEQAIALLSGSTLSKQPLICNYSLLIRSSCGCNPRIP